MPEGDSGPASSPAPWPDFPAEWSLGPRQASVGSTSDYWDGLALAWRQAHPGGGELGNHWDEARLQAMIEALTEIACTGNRAFELGCGAGRLTRRVASLYAGVVAVDSSPEMADLARSGLRDANVEIHVGTSELLKVTEASFDVAFALDVLPFMSQAELFWTMQDLARGLRPGGRFVATLLLLEYGLVDFTAYARLFDGNRKMPLVRLRWRTGAEVAWLALAAGLEVVAIDRLRGGWAVAKLRKPGIARDSPTKP